MTELAPKGPRFVEIIKIMDWPEILVSWFYLITGGKHVYLVSIESSPPSTDLA